MLTKPQNVIAQFSLLLIIALAGSTTLLANTTGPGHSGKGPSIESTGSPVPKIQAITPGPVPEELVVAGGGLEWAWASPCEAGPSGCGNPDPANQVGWRYATYEELTQSFPSCDAFIRPDESIRCASQYFDPDHSHCDMVNCQEGLICSIPGEPCVNGSAGLGYGETFYVRGDLPPTTPVPVMSLLGLMLLIFGVVFVVRRKALI